MREDASMKTTIFHVAPVHIAALRKHVVGEIFWSNYSAFESSFLALSWAIKSFLGPCSIDEKKEKKEKIFVLEKRENRLRRERFFSRRVQLGLVLVAFRSPSVPLPFGMPCDQNRLAWQREIFVVISKTVEKAKYRIFSWCISSDRSNK